MTIWRQTAWPDSSRGRWNEAAELDPAVDTVRFVLHRGADRLTVDVEPGTIPNVQ